MFKNTNMKAFKNVAKSLFLRISSFWKRHKQNVHSIPLRAFDLHIKKIEQCRRKKTTYRKTVDPSIAFLYKSSITQSWNKLHKKQSSKMQAWIQKWRLQECAKITAVPVLENCRNRTLIQFLCEHFAACDLHIKKIEQCRRKKTIYWKNEEEEDEEKKRIENLSKFCSKLAASHRAEINRIQNQSLKTEAWTQEQKKLQPECAKITVLLPATRHAILFTLLRFANAAARRRASKIEKQKSIQNLPKSYIRATSHKARRICTKKTKKKGKIKIKMHHTKLKKNCTTNQSLKNRNMDTKNQKKKREKKEAIKPSRRGCATDRCLINAEITKLQPKAKAKHARETTSKAIRSKSVCTALNKPALFALHKAGCPVTAIITIRLPSLVTAVNGGQSTIRLS